MKADHPGNLIYSPFSLSAVVAMAHAGARNTTLQEIKAAMKFPADEALYAGYAQVLTSLQVRCETFCQIF